ncbi:tagaturonate reductase [uncultured Eubacterium sp.]|uniref:tagaturonate reductase n=1 Tax=uncultured Eubacterium sp. TaxID=165185 RepID=UPI002803FA28|nr:tagaturonate reductase [uncultured Eubacterium sp.]
MKETVLQFGTGNFLRGFADYFIDAMNKQGIYDGKTVIVSPTDSGAVESINAQNGRYNLILRGIENGREVCERTEIESVTRAINPYADFDGFLSLAKNPDLRFIISNTTEAGICFDEGCKLTDRPAGSFPAKLTQLLYERYNNGLNGFVILACELIDDNGKKLEKYVLDYAHLWNLDDRFIEWVQKENTFCNTLVDRIVTGYPTDEADKIFDKIGYRDVLLDTAEPYHLWVIEGDFEDELPLVRAGFNVVWTDNVKPYKKMKVRILNGSHTSLVFPSLLCGVESVGESIKDEQLKKYLNVCLFDYILPVLDDTDEVNSFANAVLERFANPFIKHLWKSISLNSVSKFTARVLPTVNDNLSENVVPLPLEFSLSCLIEYYKTNDVTDSEYAVEFIKNNNVADILANKNLWGQDLSVMLDAVSQGIEKIHSDGIRNAIKWSIS